MTEQSEMTREECLQEVQRIMAEHPDNRDAAIEMLKPLFTGLKSKRDNLKQEVETLGEKHKNKTFHLKRKKDDHEIEEE